MSSLDGCLPVCSVREAQQQPHRVAVGGDRVRAGVSLGHQPLGEERLKCRGEQRSWQVSQGALEALGDEREQLGRGLQIPVACPRLDVTEVTWRAAASGGRTSTPARCQSSSVRTANVCLLCGTPHNRH